MGNRTTNQNTVAMVVFTAETLVQIEPIKASSAMAESEEAIAAAQQAKEEESTQEETVVNGKIT